MCTELQPIAGSTVASSSSEKAGNVFKSRTMVVGQATPTGDIPMDIDSENPIPNLNSQSDSSSREEMEGASHQDTARADLVAQAQETLLKSRFI